MKILVTGATGFLGRPLVQRLLTLGQLPGEKPIERITVTARSAASGAVDPRLRPVVGDIRDANVREAALDGGVDCVFHLAGALIAQTEPDLVLGRSVNLDATMALGEAMQDFGCPRFVFTSSIAVYGSRLPPVVTDDTCPMPNLSYGTHKLMGELFLADLSRRGWLDARCIRVPGTLPRPRLPDRAFSPAFGSNIIHATRAGAVFDSPVSPDVTLWAISMRRCIDNLIHAAALPPARLPDRRVWQMPALYLTMGELAAALTDQLGPQVRDLVRWNPDPRIEQAMGAFPRLETPLAESLGFVHDGSVATLLSTVLDDMGD